MQVFVVVATREKEAVAQKLAATIADENTYVLDDNAWMIAFDGTTRALAEKLDIRQGTGDALGIVFSISNYSGRAAKSAWEWLKVHLPREPL